MCVFRRVSDSASKGVLDVLKSIYLGFRKVKVQRVTVVELECTIEVAMVLAVLKSR